MVISKMRGADPIMGAKLRKSFITVEGAEELAKKFKLAAEEANKILDDAISKAADKVESDAKGNANFTKGYSTGELKSSITKSKVKSKKTTRVVYKIHTKKVRYAFAVEAGTSKMAAQPFLRPAMDKNKGATKDAIINALNKAMAKIDK